MLLIILPIAYIFLTGAFVCINAVSMPAISDIVSFIDITRIQILINTVSFTQAIFEFAFISIPCRMPTVLTLAADLVVFPLTFIFVTVYKVGFTIALFHALFPVALINIHMAIANIFLL